MKGIIKMLSRKSKKLKGLQETKHFGAKRRARHKKAKKKALGKKKNPAKKHFQF